MYIAVLSHFMVKKEYEEKVQALAREDNNITLYPPITVGLKPGEWESVARSMVSLARFLEDGYSFVASQDYMFWCWSVTNGQVFVRKASLHIDPSTEHRLGEFL